MCVYVCVSVSVLLWMLVAFVTEFLEMFAEVLTNAFLKHLLRYWLCCDCFALLLIKLFNNLNPGIKPKDQKNYIQEKQ